MKKWNIIFCHVDQLTQTGVSAYGGENARTPGMDRLAADGILFEDSFSSNPICCPARSCWYTGRMSSEHGTLVNNQSIEDFPDLGQWMSARGYQCFYAGKWHIARNVAKSFKLLHPQFALGEQHDSAVTRTAEAFLENYSDEEPFFLNLGMLNPHDCCYLNLAKDHLATKFGVERHFPEEIPPRMRSYDPSKPTGSKDWPADWVDLYRYYYFRMTEMVDAEIGRIYDALQNSRFAENTVFIFSADHGEMMSAHNLFKKSRPYDEALKVPLIVVQPGLPGGRRDASHLISSVDVPATILDYAGIECMPDMSVAKSFRPAIEGKDVAWREYVPCEIFQGGPQIVLTDKRYKYYRHFKTGEMMLFDRIADPDELSNLADQPDLAGVLQRFETRQQEYFETIIPSARYREEMKKARKA
ncbi:sulfatase family protein [Tichowtungia aerotolerans]|uniref:Sulfatase-like hydrolase/transferase n=1 Tax=Tichowtungia aerotolerans TaxID=2697043 RepID=A0A6P1M7I5_9BACT|nr:sulfatase-like hydrolase/transferase [Tichowtungia aerotolerans]QHI69827.1 sulfatase-like hydrolase/transferase [Tichowtungia aerotolerans]